MFFSPAIPILLPLIFFSKLYTPIQVWFYKVFEKLFIELQKHTILIIQIYFRWGCI